MITYSLTIGPISAGTVTSSGVVTLTGAGMVYLTASQAASGNYAAATATTSFVVNPEVPTLTFASIPTHTYGDSPFQVTATDAANTPSSGMITYSLTNGKISAGTVTSSGRVTLIGSGTVYLTASQMLSGNYAAATATTSFTVDPPLMITSNPLPAGVVGTSYSQTLTAIGGSATYTSWAVTANNSGLTSLGLSLTSSNGVWSISGSSSSLAAGSATFTLQVTDSIGATTTQQLTINVYKPLSLPAPNPATLGSAMASQYYNGSISGSGGSGNYSWSVTGLSSTSLNYNSTGNPLTISGTAPAMAQTLTLNVTMTDTATSQFVTQNGYTITVINPNVGYPVSGTVNYAGPDAGWIYLQLSNNNCNNCGGNLGTAIHGPGAFTIQGVPPGTYTLQAYMDNLGYGGRNVSNPIGSTQNVVVSYGPLSGVTASLSNPATVTLGTATPTWDSSNAFGAFSGGAVVDFDPICNGNGCNNGGIEIPASYTVQWSTSSSFGAVAGSQCFPATGGKNPWIVSGISGSGPYYFRAAGNMGACGSSTSGLTWSAASTAMTIANPSSGNLVQGTVTFSAPAGGITGPLYVGFADQNTGNVYVDVMGSQASPPTSPASYSVYVPTGSNYKFFGIIDQNDNGLMVPGDISNTNQQNMASVDIDPAIPSTLIQNLTLPSTNGAPTNAQAIVRTNSSQQTNLSGNVSYVYGVSLRVNGLYKLPASVDLYSGPSYIVNAPADIATGAFNGNTDEWEYSPSMNGGTPSTSDVFTYNVTYTDGASNSTANSPSNPLTASPTAVLSAWATNMSPTWNTGSASTTPTFTWNYPTGAANYAYQFQLQDSSHNTIWSIPAQNQHSNSNGFSSNITPSITWGVDPTGGRSTPSVPSLTPNSTYYWQIQATDANSNEATTQVSFQTGEAPLSLPASGALGSGTVNQAYNGSITASGGSEASYSFTVGVNGAGTTGGTSWTLPDGLSANSSGGTLTITGKPTTAPATITLAVGVTDSESHTASGTYTISIVSSQVVFPASGNVYYSGLQTGWVYLSLSPTNNCNNNGCNNPNPGTAISSAALASGATFTIHGVQPGTYNLNAWMDTLGYGVGNVSDPSGSTSVTVTNSTLSGFSFSMHDSGPVTLTSAPRWDINLGVGAFNGGAMVYFDSILNSSSVQMPTSYILQYSTDSTFNTGVSSKSFPAAHADHHWIVTGLTNGSTYYFRAAGVVGSGSSAVTGPWSVASPTQGLTIGTPTGPNTIQGTVTFSGTATGPLYVGLIDVGLGNNNVFADVIQNPVSPQAYSIQVPSGSEFVLFGIIDQNNDGWNGPGDISNFGGNGPPPVYVNGSMSNVNLTLPSSNSVAVLDTEHWSEADEYYTGSGYNFLNIISAAGKLPVAAELLSGPNVTAPEDIAMCGTCSLSDKFYYTFTPGATPTVGDSYKFQVTYSDGSSEMLNLAVSGVPPLPTSLAPAGIGGTNTSPTFTWTGPANASNYDYQFVLYDQNNNVLWEIPKNFTGLSGFPSSITSIPWGSDPTGANNPPSVSSLTSGEAYYWVVSATDVYGNWSQAYVDYVPGYTSLALPTPNPSTLGTAIAAQNYNGTIVVTGGYGPYYWSVNGCTWNCTGVSLGSGLYASNLNFGSNTLTINGTPNSTSPVSFQVYVYDSTWSAPTATYTYTIHINENPLSLPAASPNPLPSGTINQSYNGAIISSGGSGSGYVWSINGSQVNTDGATPFALSDGLNAYSNGPSLNITGTLGSTPQTITLNNVSVTDSANDTETPVTYTIAVTNPNAGYPVSGTVSYGGSDTGWVYLALISNNNNGGNQILGTAINATTANTLQSPGVAFTIHGVPPGTYTLQAWMDNLGYGGTNASNPTGSTQNVTVTDGTLSGVSVSLSNPSTVNLGSATPGFDASNGLGAFDGGAIIGFDPICNSSSGCNNGGVEMPASYEVQYSTSSSFSSVAGSTCFPATGANGNSPYIITGLTNNQTYYFRAAGNVGVCGSSTTGLNYSAPVPSGGLLIGAPSTGSPVSGTVTFTLPTGVSASGKTLYVGCYNANSSYIYVDPITSPVSPQTYSIDVPNGTNCQIFGILDLNNTGLVSGAGEISDTNNGQGMVPVTVNGTTTQNITLPSGNSVAVVQTQTNSSSSGINYGVGFYVYGEYKMPVAVQLASETPNVTGTAADVILPADIAMGAFNGNNDEFDYWPNVTGTPVVGDSYKFNVTYSDGTSETLTAAVTGVLTNAFATSLSPTGSGVSSTPDFSWDYPSSNAGSYLYQFQLTNNGNTIWAIPPRHSNSNGFASTISPFITWNVDPTGSGDTPSVSSLTAGETYNWSIATYDAYMNEAQTQVSFQTATTPLSLPGPSSSIPGPAVSGQLYTGTIAATGGYPCYSYQVSNFSGSVSSGYNYSSGSGCNTPLTIHFTPATTGTITFTVTVYDSESNSTSQNYSVNVTAALVTLIEPNAETAFIGQTFSETISASGGTGCCYSFWVGVNGATSSIVPASPSTLTLTDNLTATINSNDQLIISGTPASAATIALAVHVADNQGNNASQSQSLNVVAVPSGANNSNLQGTYVCKIDGFNDRDGARWSTLASFQADGTNNGGLGNFTKGIFDSNSRNDSTEVSGTASGTYSIGSDNNGLLTFNAVLTSGATGSQTTQWAIALTNAISPAQEFRMVETDDVGATPSGQHGTGDCYLANTSVFGTDVFTGNSFVFEMNGENGSGNPKADLGRYAASNGSVTGGVIDEANTSDTSVTTTTLTGGSYTTPDATNGRSTLSFTATKGTATFEVYVIDANRMFMIETDEAKAQSADVRKQQQATYSGANLDSNFVLYWQSYGYQNGSIAGYGSTLLQGTGDGAGNFTINQSYDDNNGAYGVGKEVGGPIPVTFDSSNPGRAYFSPGGGTIYMYFFNDNSAFFMDFNGGSPSSLETGWMEPQTQTTFTNAALAGNYLYLELPLMESTISGYEGEWNFNNANNVTGDTTIAGRGYLTYDVPLSGVTYSWLSTTYGTFSIGSRSCAVISATRAACIYNTTITPFVMILQQ